MMKITDIDALEELIVVGRQYQAAEQRLADAERQNDVGEKQAALTDIASLEEDHDRLQAVFAELDQAIAKAEANEQVEQLAVHLMRKGLLVARLDRGAEAIELFDRALGGLSPEAHERLRAELKVRRALTLAEMGRMMEADAALDEMLSEIGEDDGRGQARLLRYKGDLYLASGRDRQAESAFERALTVVPNEDARDVTCLKLGLAKALLRQDKLKSAAPILGETLTQTQESGDLEGQREALRELQSIDLSLGHIESYLEHCGLARRVAEARGDHNEVAIQRENAVAALLHLERHDEAIAMLLESLEYVRRRGPRMKKLVLMMKLGKIYFELDRLEEAESVFQNVLEEAQEQNNPRTMAVALGRLGALYAERGEPEAALRYGELALDKVDEQIDPEIVAEQQILLALTYRDLGQVDQATSACDKAIELYGRLGYDEMAEKARQLLAELAPIA